MAKEPNLGFCEGDIVGDSDECFSVWAETALEVAEGARPAAEDPFVVCATDTKLVCSKFFGVHNNGKADNILDDWVSSDEEVTFEI
jgi:hypothetical protein